MASERGEGRAADRAALLQIYAVERADESANFQQSLAAVGATLAYMVVTVALLRGSGCAAGEGCGDTSAALLFFAPFPAQGLYAYVIVQQQLIDRRADYHRRIEHQLRQLGVGSDRTLPAYRTEVTAKIFGAQAPKLRRAGALFPYAVASVLVATFTAAAVIVFPWGLGARGAIVFHGGVVLFLWALTIDTVVYNVKKHRRHAVDARSQKGCLAQDARDQLTEPLDQ